MSSKWNDIGPLMRQGQEAGVYGLIWSALEQATTPTAYLSGETINVIWNPLDTDVKDFYFWMTGLL